MNHLKKKKRQQERADRKNLQEDFTERIGYFLEDYIHRWRQNLFSITRNVRGFFFFLRE